MDSHSKFGPTSSLFIADLQDMVNQVHLSSSSASDTALSTISCTSPTWLLDSACCNQNALGQIFGQRDDMAKSMVDVAKSTGAG